MTMYEILCIANHFAEYNHIKDLVRTSALQVMRQGGVVRSLTYWGNRTLPQRMRRHQQWYTQGDYWSINFDSSPQTMQSLVSRLRQDPRVIRWTTLKVGETVFDMVKEREKTIERGGMGTTDDDLRQAGLGSGESSIPKPDNLWANLYPRR